MNDEDKRDLTKIVPIESPLEVFKRHMVQLFDLDPEFVKNLEIRKGLEFDLDHVPTRRENLGYEWIPTEDDRKRSKSVPVWAKEVICPKCGAIMVPIKSKAETRFGENVTYQCHRVDANQQMCLVVLTIMTGVYYCMRPGDFTKSDWDWESVAHQTVPVIPGVKVADISAKEDFQQPKSMNWCPWTKNTQNKVIWDTFWEIILRDGECGVDELREKVLEIRPKDKVGSYRYKLDRELKNLPDLMQKRSGYVIKSYGKVFRVVGKAKGDPDTHPYSDAQYRKEHGF